MVTAALTCTLTATPERAFQAFIEPAELRGELAAGLGRLSRPTGGPRIKVIRRHPKRLRPAGPGRGVGHQPGNAEGPWITRGLLLCRGDRI